VLQTCARCNFETYCGSRECQKAHWPTHKRVCSRLPANGSKAHQPGRAEGDFVGKWLCERSYLIERQLEREHVRKEQVLILFDFDAAHAPTEGCIPEVFSYEQLDAFFEALQR